MFSLLKIKSNCDGGSFITFAMTVCPKTKRYVKGVVVYGQEKITFWVVLSQTALSVGVNRSPFTNPRTTGFAG
jgi:hypothetical protein